MPSFKLNDREIPFEPGDTIIRAAARHGIEIPHYCWHPGLTSPANCRMCLVEVKSQRPMMLPVLKWDAQKNEYVEATKPKLVPSCQQAAAEGMEVSSESSEVKQAQASVQEFLLLNHPVDCPICDQAGECKLQDYWLDHQTTLKRKATEPVHKVKGVSFGPTIVYDGERCVMCTRCIRFNDEIAKDHVLDMRERGNTNEIVLAPGRELDHKYTLMNEHVCPVGALTSRDFRFKARVWFLKTAPSVCTGCATGCNTWLDYDPRTQEVMRIRPRDNPEVNEYWMCDDGMLSYHEIHRNRAAAAFADGHKVSVGDAVRSAADLLSRASGARVAVVLSAEHSTEDNFITARFARDHLKTSLVYLAAKPGWEGDEILRSNDNNPNRRGAERAFGAPLKPVSELPDAIARKEIDAVIVLGSGVDPRYVESLSRVPTIILATHATLACAASKVVLPVCVTAEMNGSFINEDGRVQAFKRAINAPGDARPAWEIVLDVAQALKADMGVRGFSEVSAAVAKAIPAPASVDAVAGAAE